MTEEKYQCTKCQNPRKWPGTCKSCLDAIEADLVAKEKRRVASLSTGKK
jgi:predicted ATP-dependent serine protease